MLPIALGQFLCLDYFGAIPVPKTEKLVLVAWTNLLGLKVLSRGSLLQMNRTLTGGIGKLLPLLNTVWIAVAFLC